MKSYEEMSEAVTKAATSRIGARDFAAFASRCGRLSAPLGVVVAMHAEAADGNSPDVSEWIQTTMEEWIEVSDLNREQAKAWWIKQYAHHCHPDNRATNQRKNMNLSEQINEAIKRSISHNEVVTVEVSDLSEAAIEVSAIADDCDSCEGIERGDTTGTDIWGDLDGEDFRLFLRKP